MLLRNKIDQYTIELRTQASSCPSTLSSLEIIDQRLKEFVRLHHISLLKTISYQLNKLKDNIYEKQLSKQLACYCLTTEQVINKKSICMYIYSISLFCSYLVRSNQSLNNYS
jgi:hypothetical protein